VELWCARKGKEVWFHIKDNGNGIPDIKAAMEPMYTTKPEQERSGMGFSFMEAFTDELIVESAVGEGTLVKMKKIMW
jgi:stage II sporulation protein AB (anti-sigma F factor)